MEISAKIVADSISSSGVRITTMELCYHRFIHSEFMTHRMFSRNSSSSRAIPVGKMLKQVKENPAIPIFWGKNQPGMQAKDNLSGTYLEEAKESWYYAAHQMSKRAGELTNLDLHKQITNRLLEPFQWIKVIVTATEWDNFFKLRLHPDAQPEICFLAKTMKEVMDSSSPVILEHSEWHLPYVVAEDCLKTTTDNFVKLSVARCARVSYLNHDNSTPDVAKDIALADKLLEAGHMSCFEHQATPMKVLNEVLSDITWENGITHVDKYDEFWSNNFRGWLQYRAM